ncbi:serine/threonine-protein phosphatase 6 regulatory ankyrin repeat subunit A-like [Ptychodera flava]|uniref:serine/threonine-protein phosphatase 6 regulatory ankyrin repeat subunit A-like n=1 Tax=Ptychodera flava TaxID=63121 RepID=UPI003969F85F
MVEVAFHYNIAQRRQSPFFNMKSIVERCSVCMEIAKYSSKYGGKEKYFCSQECHNRYNLRKAKVKNLVLIRLDESGEESEGEEDVILVNERTESIDHRVEERLFRICRNGDHERLHRLLEKELYLDISDEKGRSLISVAAFYGDSVMLKMLLYCDADANYVGEDGVTALMAATESDDPKKVQLLLAVGAKPKVPDNNGRVALHLAATNSNAKCAKLLLEADPTTTNLRDKFNITPLHLAAGKENLDIIRLLLNWGASTIEDNMGRLPLHWAVVEGSMPCVTELLMGSKTNDLDRADKMGQTAIHYAVHLNFPEIVELLVDKDCDLTIKNSRGLTPLLLAACSGDQSTCELLISANDKTLHDVDKMGWGALHYAASRNEDGLVNFFIDAGLDVDLRDERGHSPIFIAATNGAVKVAKTLIKKGALSLTVIDKTGRTPLHYAAEGGHTRVVSLLVAVISMMKIARKLIEMQAWIDRKDDEGDTALFLAAIQGHIEVSQLLLDYNATVYDREVEILKKLGITIPQTQIRTDTDFEELFKDNPYKPATFFQPRRTTKQSDHFLYVYSAPVVKKGPLKKPSKKPAWNDSTLLSTPVKATLSIQREPTIPGSKAQQTGKWIPTSRHYNPMLIEKEVTPPAVLQTSRYFDPNTKRQLSPNRSFGGTTATYLDPVAPRPHSSKQTPQKSNASTPPATQQNNEGKSRRATEKPSANSVSVTPPKATNIEDTNNSDSSPTSPSNTQRHDISGRVTPTELQSRRQTKTPGIVSLKSTNLAEINEETESEA